MVVASSIFSLCLEVSVMNQLNEFGDDEVVGKFLKLLAKDIAMHPERLHKMDSQLTDLLLGLTADVDFDLDEPLDPANE